MHLHNVYVKKIKQANESDRLAVFVGAGVSKSSDTDYMSLPLWRDLIAELKSDLSIHEDIEYLKLAQLYFLEFGEQVYNQTLKKYFPEDIAPSSLHIMLLKLAPRIIITTNWDCIIEKTIEQEGYLYDTICTDKDLVSSTTPNKFIKIHGDFKNHNIVFKEDDYLNYSKNFPLIENYIKSVFSTHTILFLGYSYSDINLKHIMKWIQSHSRSSPPMYLISFDENKSQESYLKNHGITTLVLNDKIYSTGETQSLDQRSALTKSFLESIIEGDRAVDLSDEQEVINCMCERIEHLKKQSLVTHTQVQRAITNCNLRYDGDGLSILELFETNGCLTTDYDKTTRSLHRKFLEILTRLEFLSKDEKDIFYRNNPKLMDFFSILSLAYIKGIILPNDDESGRFRYYINEKTSSAKDLAIEDIAHISFSFCKCKSHDLINSLSSESYESYKSGNYELAFRKNAELILICKRHRIYSVLLIALFNRDSLLWILKYSLAEKQKKTFEDEEKIKLQDEFFKFPRAEIKKNQVLYDFLSLNHVYQQANNCTKAILDLTKTVESIKRGGISFNNNANKPTSEHINLLMFSIKNHIMIDHHAAFKDMMRDFVKISLLRQSLNKTTNLNQYELYSAIQFYSPQELQTELRRFVNDNDSIKPRLELDEECSEWVAFTILPKLTDNLIQDRSIVKPHGNRFVNCVRLLALINFDDNHIEKVMSEFSRLINSGSTTIGTYESINEFLAHQYNLFKREIETDILIKILNTIIDKLIYKKAHAWDQHAILNGHIKNLYDYIGVVDGEYDDEGRVLRLVSEISTHNQEAQKSFCHSLLYNIYNISNDSVKKIIRDFIEQVISQPKTKEIDDWEFELWAVASEFKPFDPTVITDLDEYLEEFRDGTKFSSRLISLKDLTQYLVDEKDITELEEINAELGDLISQRKTRQYYSI